MKKHLLILSTLLLTTAMVSAETTFTKDSYEAVSKSFNQKSSGILNPDAGSISFTFTGKFDRFGKEAGNLYKLFYSGHNRLAVNQLRKNVFRLYFHTKDADGKHIGIDHENIDHGEKCGHTCNQFDFDGCLSLCEAEKLIHKISPSVFAAY